MRSLCIFNIFLWLKLSPSLILTKIEHFSKVLYYEVMERDPLQLLSFPVVLGTDFSYFTVFCIAFESGHPDCKATPFSYAQKFHMLVDVGDFVDFLVLNRGHRQGVFVGRDDSPTSEGD